MKTILHICLVFVALIQAEMVQLRQARDLSDMEYLGLPGWIPYNSSWAASRSQAQGSLAAGSVQTLAFPTGFTVTRNGDVYTQLSVDANGVVTLGKESEIQVVAMPYGRGATATTGSLVRWQLVQDFNNSDRFLAVEMHGFKHIATGNLFSFQVVIFQDGEIQFFYRDYSIPGNTQNCDAPDYSWLSDDSPKIGVQDGTVWFEVPNVKRLFLSRLEDIDSWEDLFSSRGRVREELAVFSDGKLRQGWIGKSFDGHGTGLRLGPDKKLFVSFQSRYWPGGLLAFDEAREYPYVGGVQCLDVDLNKQSAVHPYVWFFEETKRTDLANYPRSGALLPASELEHCTGWPLLRDITQIPRCIYADSYVAALLQAKNPSDMLAPAVKLQMGDNEAAGTAIFDKIAFNPAQPLSVQFRSPPTLKITVTNGTGGVSLVEDRTPRSLNPIPVRYGTSQVVTLKALDGNGIQKVKVNGSVVFADDKVKGSSKSYACLEKDAANELCLRFELNLRNIKKNVQVVADYKKCDLRNPIVLPGLVQTTRYLDDPKISGARKEISYSIPDGFGNTVETQTEVGNGRYLVASSYKDGLGKTLKTVKPFVYQSAGGFAYVDLDCATCITKAKEYFDGSDAVARPYHEGAPYAETIYRGDPLGTVAMSAGVGGRSSYLAGQPTRSWSIAVQSANAFLTAKQLNAAELDKRSVAVVAGATHLLQVSCDPDGRWSQSIADADGRTVAVWANADQENDARAFVSVSEYDELGRRSSAYPQKNSTMKETSEYNQRGQLSSSTGPDRGKTENRYDKAGRLRFVRTARHVQMGTNYFSAKVYDDLGRVVESGEVKGGFSFETPDGEVPDNALVPVVRSAFDRVDLTWLAALGLPQSVELAEEAAKCNVRQGDLWAVASYAPDGKAVSVRMYTYDRLGRKVAEFLALANGVPLVRLAYQYNDAGELVYSSFSDRKVGGQWETRGVRERTYDSKGRLAEVKQDGEKSVVLAYTEAGSLKQSERYAYGASSAAVTLSAERDIAGNTTYFSAQGGGKKLYEQKIEREGATSRITGSTHQWLIGSTKWSHPVEYAYDDRGRLVSAEGAADGSYAYDEYGRFASKHEGASTISGFSYYDNAYRLKSVAGPAGYGSAADFVYDASGNLAMDKGAKQVFVNDARGLPVKIAHYATGVPSSLTVAQVLKDQLPTGADRVVEIAYDESGTRVWRSVDGMRESVLPGIAVYRETSAGAGYDLALLLNEGGFQAGEGGPEFFEVKDHQGNVRALVNGSGEVAQADGYHPYGTPVPLKVASAAANPPWKWQGKEWDGDVGLFYFGARYWNVELALWLSPDPAGQFANPYTFGGDPVNMVDPDGRLAFLVPVVIGATVGAYIGASMQSKSWNPTKWDSDAWKGGIAGAFVGGLGGAFAAQGFAAAGFNMGISAGGEATASYGLTSSILTGANTNMAFGLASGSKTDQLWGHGLVGAATGAATATGGFGALKSFGGKAASSNFQKASVRLAYANTLSIGGSIGNNIASGKDWNSRIRLNLGPVDAVVGKDATLADNLFANAGNIAVNTVGFVGGDQHNWKWENLTYEHSGGLLDGSKGYFGAHAVLGPAENDMTLDHELSHVTQSRASGMNFWGEYGLQGALSAAGGGNFLNQNMGGTNYYETIGYTNVYGY